MLEVCEEEKCLTCSEESNLLGLCLSCNEAKGYKKVNYTTVLTEFYDCILNTSSKINKFYYNETTQEYRPCYKRCKTCSKAVVYSEFYYITPYDQYKALDTLQCPEESKYLVKDGNKSYCIYDCKNDEVYKYLYNGVCLKECPSNTVNRNYICNEITDKCNLGEIIMDEKNNITKESTDILVKTYISEFNYTNKHVTLHKNKKYSIIIYKNRECISELSLEMPKVDFKDCYDKVKSYYQINEDLIIVIINRKENNNNGQTYYSFFHPLYGNKLDAEEICKDETIKVTQNLTSILKEDTEKYELQSFLIDQGINIFYMDDPFYTDLCYDFENPCNKDIPLSQRIKIIYPAVSLCDEGCQMDGIDLDTMTALCNCKFNDIANNNMIKDNELLNSVVGDIFDFVESSNILVMKCYNYIFKDFSNSIGGILSIVSIAGSIICSLTYFLIGKSQIKVYVYNIFDLREQLIMNKNKKGVKFNLEPKEIKIKSKKENNFDNYSTMEKRRIKIEKPKMDDYDVKSTYNDLINFRLNSEKNFKSEKELEQISIKSKNKNKNKKIIKKKLDIFSAIKEDQEYSKFFEEYLATSLDDLEYDDAKVKDERKFCEYLKERLKKNQMIAFTFISSDPIKIRSMKIMLFILNIVLYFVVVGLFYNEDYINTLFNLDENDEHFFSYITRSIDKFIYTTLVSIVIGYIVDCFFVEESKIKGIFRREKDNLVQLKIEIVSLINNILNKNLSFIIMLFGLLILAFYYLLCFNYVYPKTQIEWLKCSVTIFILMQILSTLKCFLQASLRFLSFSCDSEKLFKISRLLN